METFDNQKTNATNQYDNINNIVIMYNHQKTPFYIYKFFKRHDYVQERYVIFNRVQAF